MPDTISALLLNGAGSEPSILGVQDLKLTFNQLRDQVERLSGQLRGLGIGLGDRVGIVLPNGPEMAITFLAVAATATAAPLNPAYREEEFRFYLDDLEAKALITLPGDAPAAHAALSPAAMRLSLEGAPGDLKLVHDGVEAKALDAQFAGADDIALVLHTSGTTA